MMGSLKALSIAAMTNGNRVYPMMQTVWKNALQDRQYAQNQAVCVRLQFSSKQANLPGYDQHPDPNDEEDTGEHIFSLF